MPKNQPTAAKKARTAQRAVGGKHTALLATQTRPAVQLRLTWEERDGEHWTTYQGRHYALIVHGDWHTPNQGPNGRDIWYLHEMHDNGNIRYEDDQGEELEGWWIADAHRIRNLKRHPDLIRVAELHIDGWHWSGVYRDGTRAMSRSTWDQRRPLPELLASATLGPWIIPDGVCGNFTHFIDIDDHLPCPHPRGHDFPCNDNPDFDADAWRTKDAAERAAEQARRAALTPEERAEEDELARQWEYDDMRAAAASEYADDHKYYGDED
ncbi:hypothetical protein [Streptomyces decoyicus]|uniref:hypothetical protein n=1 Tax=Streptomyces decoyicus TaxID=249567 RepID=UPI002F906F43